MPINPKVTAAEASLKEATTALLEELQAGKSDRLQRLLDFSARFHHYSPHNQHLIEVQCLLRGIEANHIAGFKTWERLGYTPKGTGNKGILVLVHTPKRVSQTNTKTGEEVFLSHFKAGYVWADTQVIPLRADVPPVPVFFAPLQGDCTTLFAHLSTCIRARGIQLVEQAGIVEQGYSVLGRIVLKAGLDSQNAFLTLLHEYTHELLHDKEARVRLSKTVKECHAEAVSYIVARHFGVPNPYSADYLYTWSVTPTELNAQLTAVQQMASLIIDELDPPSGSGSGSGSTSDVEQSEQATAHPETQQIAA